MKKLLLLMLLPLILCDCMMMYPETQYIKNSVRNLPSKEHGDDKSEQYSESQYLIHKSVVEEKSVDELCQILEKLHDPIIDLTCNDDENGIVTFRKWTIFINFFVPFPIILPVPYYSEKYAYNLDTRHFIKSTLLDSKNIEEKYQKYLKQKENNQLKDFYEFFTFYFPIKSSEATICVSCRN